MSEQTPLGQLKRELGEEPWTLDKIGLAFAKVSGNMESVLEQNHKGAALAAVDERDDERIWLRETHEKDGWKFGYYADRPQDDSFVEYARVRREER